MYSNIKYYSSDKEDDCKNPQNFGYTNVNEFTEYTTQNYDDDDATECYISSDSRRDNEGDAISFVFSDNYEYDIHSDSENNGPIQNPSSQKQDMVRPGEPPAILRSDRQASLKEMMMKQILKKPGTHANNLQRKCVL